MFNDLLLNSHPFFDFNVFRGSDWNASKKNDGFIITLNAQGLKKDEIFIEIDGDVLEVKGKTERELPFWINNNIEKRWKIENLNDVKATLEDGILSLEVKTKSKKNLKQISIH